MKILRRLTLAVGAAGICVGAVLFWLSQRIDQSPALSNPQQLMQQFAQAWEGTPSEKVVDPEERALQIREGNSLLRQARLLLTHNTSPVSASVLQIIQTPEETFRGTGKYWQAVDARCRLHLEMEIGETKGRMLQVSNGQVIWMVRDIVSPRAWEDRKLQIERVDLQRLADFAREAEITAQEPNVAREMQGGLPGLLSTLESLMNFRLIKRVALNQEACIVLEGEWKTDLDQEFDSDFAANVYFTTRPDKVRLFIREGDLFPLRYFCLKKRPDKAGYYAQLAMELTDVKRLTHVDPGIFNYRPPEDEVPNDITHEYLTRLEVAARKGEDDETVK